MSEGALNKMKYIAFYQTGTANYLSKQDISRTIRDIGSSSQEELIV